MFLCCLSKKSKKEEALAHFSKGDAVYSFEDVPKPEVEEVDVLEGDWWFEGKPNVDFDKKLEKWGAKRKLPKWALAGLGLQMERATIQRQRATINQISHKPQAPETQGDIAFPYLKMQQEQAKEDVEEKSEHSQNSKKSKSKSKSDDKEDKPKPPKKTKSTPKNAKSTPKSTATTQSSTDKSNDDILSSCTMDQLLEQIMKENIDSKSVVESQAKWDPWGPLEELANRPEFKRNNIIFNTTYSTALVQPSPEDKAPGTLKSEPKGRINFATKQKVGIYDNKSMTPAQEGNSEPLYPAKL